MRKQSWKDWLEEKWEYQLRSWKRRWEWLKENWDKIILVLSSVLAASVAFYLANKFFFEPEKAGTATLILAFAIFFYAGVAFYLGATPPKKINLQNLVKIILFFGLALGTLLGTPLVFYLADKFFFEPEKAGTATLIASFPTSFFAIVGLYLVAKRIEEMNRQNRANLALVLWIFLGPPLTFCLAYYFAYDFFFFESEEASTTTLIAYITAFFTATAGLYLAARRTEEMGRENEIALKRNDIEDYRNTTDISLRVLEQLANQDSPLIQQSGIILLRRLGETAHEKGNKTEKEGIINTLANVVRTQSPLPQEKDLPPPKDRKDRLVVEEAIKALASITEGEEERRKVNLNSTDLRKIHLSVLGETTNLSFFNLNDANLSGTLLDNANLSEARLGYANLSGARLMHANLSKTSLENANLSGARLMYANLSKASLENANLREALLGNANLFRAWLGEINLFGAWLVNANLSKALLSRSNLSYTRLENANLSEVELMHANLSAAKLDNANLSEAELMHANLSGAQLMSANLSMTQLEMSKNLKRDQLNDIRYYLNYEPSLPEEMKDLEEEMRSNPKEHNIIQKGDLDYDEEELERLREKYTGENISEKERAGYRQIFRAWWRSFLKILRRV